MIPRPNLEAVKHKIAHVFLSLMSSMISCGKQFYDTNEYDKQEEGTRNLDISSNIRRQHTKLEDAELQMNPCTKVLCYQIIQWF